MYREQCGEYTDWCEGVKALYKMDGANFLSFEMQAPSLRNFIQVWVHVLGLVSRLILFLLNVMNIADLGLQVLLFELESFNIQVSNQFVTKEGCQWGFLVPFWHLLFNSW